MSGLDEGGEGPISTGICNQMAFMREHLVLWVGRRSQNTGDGLEELLVTLVQRCVTSVVIFNAITISLQFPCFVPSLIHGLLEFMVAEERGAIAKNLFDGV